jgi:hypothetical protein
VYEIDKSAGFFIALGSGALATDIAMTEGALDWLNLNDTRFTDQRSFKDAVETITIQSTRYFDAYTKLSGR